MQDQGVRRLRLLVHHLCPYAQRALYTAAFKSASMEIVEVALDQKPEILTTHSPLGKVPTLILDFPSGRQVNISESKEVADFIDSLPGPVLYPRNAEGQVCPLSKALVDMHVRLTIDPLPPFFFKLMRKIASPTDIRRARKMLDIIDRYYVKNGNFFMHSLLEKNQLTMADVLLYPFAERFFAYRLTTFAPLNTAPVPGLEKWFETMSGFPWIQRYRALPQRLLKVQQLYESGQFRGLTLPLTSYDS